MEIKVLCNDPNEAAIVKNGVVFLYTRQMVEQHLSEGWMEDESAFCEVDGETVELYPRHYRQLLDRMNRAVGV